MKTKISLLIALLISITSIAQQQGINYKALIKDASGNVVAGQNINVKFSIIEDTGATVVYSEDHTNIMTDANGIIILSIGEGTPLTNTFASIAWGSDTHSLKIEIDIEQDTTYEDLGTTQFKTVPYAINAGNAGATSINDLSDGKSDNDGTNNGSSLFLGINAGANDDGTNNSNIGIGYQALFSNVEGLRNTATGYQALYSNVGNGSTSFLGHRNTANGYQSLFSNTTGENNTANGYQSLFSNNTGGDNTANGFAALYSNVAGFGNVALGYRAGYFETGSNKLYIDNSSTNTPLIYGEFNTNKLTINGDLEVTGTNNLTSGLEEITEGGNTGWRLKGRYPANYGNIGEEAVDLSSSNFSSDTFGASGDHSTAMGDLTIASGNYSTAMGQVTDASGDHSTAMGSFTTASGDSSTAMGVGTIASHQRSTAMGSYTTASGYSSTAMGSSTTASGDYSTAMGFDTTASGNYSTAMGSYTTASGINSTAMGRNTTASEDYSTAMGLTTTASGYSSTAMGSSTTASGDYSTAMGRSTTASDNYSTAMGFNTTASGLQSTAMGFNTTAASNSSLAIGSYNLSIFGTNRLFTVGNGTNSSNRGNAFTVYRGTDAKLNTFNSGFVMIGNNSSANLLFDTNEIMARNNGVAANLHLQADGGSVWVGGSMVHSSDRRLKKDIETLPYGLEEILQLQPKAYNWKNRTQDHKSLGLIAQEVQPLIKEIVTTQDDEEKTLGINYTELIPILINAIKEQQAIIMNSESRITNYETEVNGLKNRLEKIEALLVSNKEEIKVVSIKK